MSALDRLPLAQRVAGRDRLNQMLYVNAKTVLPNFILNYLADRMEMAHSIEGRVPFLDHHIAEVAARVPVNMKVKGIREKHVLIPEVYDRQKHPFTTPPTRNKNDPMPTFLPGYVRLPSREGPDLRHEESLNGARSAARMPGRSTHRSGRRSAACRERDCDARAVLHGVSRRERSLAHFAQHGGQWLGRYRCGTGVHLHHGVVYLWRSRHPGFLFPGGGRGAQRVVLEILTATLVARSGVGFSRKDDESRTAW